LEITMFKQRTATVNRQTFNPKSPAHVKSLETFLRTGTWGDVSFFIEAPFTDVPTTVLTKFALAKLNVTPETAAERMARYAAKNVLVIDDMDDPVVNTPPEFVAQVMPAVLKKYEGLEVEPLPA
jgi:hypothetical protein